MIFYYIKLTYYSHHLRRNTNSKIPHQFLEKINICDNVHDLNLFPFYLSLNLAIQP